MVVVYQLYLEREYEIAKVDWMGKNEGNTRKEKEREGEAREKAARLFSTFRSEV